MKHTVCVMGANPAWQKTLFFPNWKPGNVNRASRMEEYPSGKGVNFCRAARCFGKSDTILFQFAGGANGERLCAGLDQAGFVHNTVKTAAATRSCITCLDADGGMTELIEPSAPATADECGKFLSELKNTIGKCGMLAITGSLPDGTDLELYLRAAKTAFDAGVPVLADIVKKVDSLLKMPGRLILKVNREEFLKITGTDDFDSALAGASKTYPDAVFAITDGPAFAYLAAHGSCLQYAIPHLEKIVSPLGSGDTASAVLASCLLDGLSAEDAFRYALAAASANCLSATAGSFTQKDLEAIYTGIRVSRK